ncbi:AIPR family protein [Acinetobacter sp. YH01005]|uniref:AIPR family protein n=1 Tax=Acinetobacter sp. YH01005 TaxID=2601021 RepID=UPI0015D2079F|nr:AIPR family protein [Acinetobacter sp. YH01005]
MSLQHLLNEQIDILFEKDKDLKDYNGDKYEKAVPIFCNLKHLNGLENEELMAGILGSGGDQGVDVSYTFHNSELINSDSEIDIKKDHTIRFVFFQIKRETSFKTNGFKLFKEGIEKIFDLDTTIESIQEEGANKEYINLCQNTREIWKNARRASATILVDIFFVTQAPNTKLAAAIEVNLEKLRKKLESTNIKFNSLFLNARDVLDLVQKTDDKIGINFQNPPLNIKDKSIATSGFAGIIDGNTLLKSFSETDKSLDNTEITVDQNIHLKFKNYLTEGNVRYFLGEKTHINKGIIDSAKDEDNAEIFWAMNNGLTIICEKITDISSTEFELLNPSIVNGCQTIHCLYQAREELQKPLPKKLGVFCKIIQTENFSIQSKIILSTNSQNEVKTASLKANDSIQKSIEEYLLPFEIYYERRENYYKRKNYTGNKVISLTRMAQILQTVINKESIAAINDVKKCFEINTLYQSIFDETTDFDIYKFSTLLYLKTLSLKNSDLRNNQYELEDKSLISKSTFVILHILSSLVISNSQSDNDEQCTNSTKKIKIAEKKNDFNLKKKNIFLNLEDNEFMKKLYSKSIEILLEAANQYTKSTGKERNSLLKQRKFDNDFLIPCIDSFLKRKKSLNNSC